MGSSGEATSLSSKAARGFAWAIGQTLFARVFGLVCQFVLAKVLLKQDFGMVAFAQSIATFVAIGQMAGLPEILVQRQKRFTTWSNAAFWMALSIGACSAVFVAGIGPVAAWYKGNAQLVPIMLIVAVQSVLSSLMVLPMATLQVQMRLRAITTLNLTLSVGGMGLSALLALAGMGAYALVLGPLGANAAVLAWGWWLTKPRVKRHAHFGRWKYLWGDSVLLLAIGVVNTFVTQGAVFMLGVAQPEAVVGVFSWAYMLSLQTIVLVTGSLNVVFFPTLSKLQDDPKRMLAAFLRAARVLAMVGMPACFLQAACTKWFIDLLFKDKWDDAAPAAVILSVGLAFGVLSSLPVNLMKAAGMFKRLFWITVGYTSLYMIGVGAAVAAGRLGWSAANPATLVAWAVAVVYLVAGPGGTYVVIKPFGGTWRDVWSVYGRACCASALAVVGAWSAAKAIPVLMAPERVLMELPRGAALTGEHVQLMTRLGATAVLAGVLYVPLARVVMADSFLEMFQRGRDLVMRRQRGAVSA